jgi:Domain of unknown function (DUF4209)
LWGAVEVVRVSEAFTKKAALTNINWAEIKGRLYEKLADEAAQQNNPAEIAFAEKALRYYKESKIAANIQRLELRYAQVRGAIKLGSISYDLPDENTERAKKEINSIINSTDANGLLNYFAHAPMYPSVKSIKETAEESLKSSSITDLFSTSRIDKFGNTIDRFNTYEEKGKHAFWQYYDFSFQFGTQWLVYAFIKSFKTGKLSYNGVVDYMEKTWYNSAIKRNYSGFETEIKPIDILKPGLEYFFDKLIFFESNQKKIPDVSLATDGLVLKIEALLRFMCEKINIPTFKMTKSKDGNNHDLVMEKTLDEILAALQDKEENKTGFLEDDRIFIKYILSEKVGLNLRNRVAHGLMDINEYGFEHPVLLFTIIMRLSKYSLN